MLRACGLARAICVRACVRACQTKSPPGARDDATADELQVRTTAYTRALAAGQNVKRIDRVVIACIHACKAHTHTHRRRRRSTEVRKVSGFKCTAVVAVAVVVFKYVVVVVS